MTDPLPYGYVVQASEAFFDTLVGYAATHPEEFPQGQDEGLMTEEALLRRRSFDLAKRLLGNGQFEERIEEQVLARGLVDR